MTPGTNTTYLQRSGKLSRVYTTFPLKAKPLHLSSAHKLAWLDRKKHLLIYPDVSKPTAVSYQHISQVHHQLTGLNTASLPVRQPVLTRLKLQATLYSWQHTYDTVLLYHSQPAQLVHYHYKYVNQPVRIYNTAIVRASLVHSPSDHGLW